MTRKLTPAQLDEIEAVARSEITARVTPPSIDQVGRVRREWETFLKAATPINVLALIYDLRQAEATIERMRALHQPAETVDDGDATFDPTPCTCGHWDFTQCPDRRALGEEV